MRCIPPEQSAEFVCAMENVLEVYHRPYDPKQPVVCMDETSKQLVKETRLPQPAAPRHPERFDYCRRNLRARTTPAPALSQRAKEAARLPHAGCTAPVRLVGRRNLRGRC